ncbi:MAG: hypothetical protein ACT4PM_08205 [Gemmatimonadales bacterium]
MRVKRGLMVVAWGSSIALLAACSGESLPTASARVTNQASVPVFVIGDAEAHAVGDLVTFWGAQWWKENALSNGASSGVASFKGYADGADDFCGGVWSSWPGNSSNPPATIPDEVMVIVASRVTKSGPVISGDITEIVMVRHDGGYGPNPGHAGKGTVTSVACGGGVVVIL